MAIEKKWEEVPQQLFTADGTVNGIITVASVAGYFVKQMISIQSLTQPPQRLQIKRVLSPTKIKVGPSDKSIKTETDVSLYLVSEGSVIYAAEQERTHIPTEEHERAVYAEEPIVAKRVISVDEFGRYWNYNNPFPVSIEESSNPIPTNEKISVVDVNKDSQIAFTFPVSFNGYKIRVRDANDKVKLAFASTDIANGNYYTIDMGWEYESPKDKNFQSGKTIYIQGVHKNNSKVEIIYFY
jgi:hypothetical protein